MSTKLEYYRDYHQKKQETDPEYKQKKTSKAKEYYHTKNKNTIVLINTTSKEKLEDWQLELEYITMQAQMKWHNEIVPQMRKEYYENLLKKD